MCYVSLVAPAMYKINTVRGLLRLLTSIRYNDGIKHLWYNANGQVWKQIQVAETDSKAEVLIALYIYIYIYIYI